MQRSGLAKSKFFEVEQRAPWNFQSRKETLWPYLNPFLDAGVLSYLDLSLTHYLLKEHPQATQENAAFICHLLLAAKNGHLCVNISESRFAPSILEIWQSNEGNGIDENSSNVIQQMILDGSKNVPRDLISFHSSDGTNSSLAPIYFDHDRFYLQRHWILESKLLGHINNHLSTQPELLFDIASIEAELALMALNGVLNEEQRDAILKSCLSPLALIAGGPGTGKTYTAGQLIKVLWKSFSAEQKANCQIALAAPTGKAAANLQKSLSNATSTLEGLPPLQAKTLHSLLGIKSSDATLKRFVNQLSADIVVIDESSMIDVKMMGILFQALKPGSHLILIGDQHQLPSIEAGSIFYDLMQIARSSSSIPCTELKKCLRAELHSILQLAQHVNKGECEEVLELIRSNQTPGIGSLQLPAGKQQAQQAFVDQMKSLFHSNHHADSCPADLLNSFNGARILSPLRKGPFGVDEINKLLLAQLTRQAPSHGWLAIPIIIVANDYHNDLFNGETGVLMRKLPHQSHSLDDYALFPGQSPNDPPRRFSALTLPKHEYAYCLSVYKSQGSEFDRVILCMPEGSECFGREMFYTAITRAKRQIDIYATNQVLRKTIQQQGTRLSGLQHRFVVQNQIKGDAVPLNNPPAKGDKSPLNSHI